MTAEIPPCYALNNPVTTVAAPGASKPSKLYPIVDFDVCARHGVEPVSFAKLAIEVQPRWLQLRGKHASAAQLLAALDSLVEPARQNGVELVVNDRPDLAALAGAPFVHVGQDDSPVEAIRRFQGSLGVGVSTHSPEQLERALLLCPDYVAYGPVFDTSTKDRPDPTVGLTALRHAGEQCRAARIPLVAIGGIDEARLALVREHVEGIAVVSALFARGRDVLSLRAQLRRLAALADGAPVSSSGV